MDVSKTGQVRAVKITNTQQFINHPFRLDPDFKAEYFMVQFIQIFHSYIKRFVKDFKLEAYLRIQ